MRSSPPSWRTRAKAVLATAVMIAAAALAAPGAYAAASTPSGAVGPSTAATPTGAPTLTNGFGLTQVNDPLLQADPTVPETPYDFTITVTTPDVANDPGTVGHHIRIILPPDYYSNPTARYPTLYLLDGSPGDPCAYFSSTYFPQFNALAHSAEMITVMPDGGSRGWYSNWADQTTAAGAQEWESFEIDQVIPFIDANLRTIADKQDRAIAGISMGGFGALHLAQDNPTLFSQVATLSGDNDLSENQMVLRLAVVDSLTDVSGAIVDSASGSGSASGDWSGGSCRAPSDPFSPAVSSDALFGSPYPISLTPPYNDSLWNAADPTENAADFAGMHVSIYIGSGNVSVQGGFESWLQSSSQDFDAALTATGQTPYFVDYGGGAGWGSCDGGHDALCWDQDLANLLPRLATAFGRNPVATGAVTGYQGLCLDDRSGGVAPGNAVQVYNCNGDSQQTWTVGGGDTLQAYGECLDVVGGGTSDGTQVELNTCDGSAGQQWLPQTDGALLNQQSGRCLDDTNWGGSGTQAQIWDCTGSANQDWDLPSLTA